MAEATASENKNPQDKKIEIPESKFQELMNRLNQLENKLPARDPEAALRETAKLEGTKITNAGVQGVMYKYPVDKGHYPDPTKRLAGEPELARFAFGENYILDWDVEGITYEKYNITYSEPRFTITLRQKRFDDEGKPIVTSGENGEEYISTVRVSRHIQHEDELSTRKIASQVGLRAPEFADLMNEVRYRRIKRWLVDGFKPNRQNSYVKKEREMVIDGKIMVVEDVEKPA